jgi:hypothetical protein
MAAKTAFPPAGFNTGVSADCLVSGDRVQVGLGCQRTSGDGQRARLDLRECHAFGLSPHRCMA